MDNLLHGPDIRGIAGETLCCRQVMLLARAFGDLASPEGDGQYAVGYDVRTSSPSMAESVSLGLRSGGHHVTHLGACTTPRLEWYTDHSGLHGGIMITGGREPPHWNGLRFYGPYAHPKPAGDVIRAAATLDLDYIFSGPCNPIVRHVDTLADYTANLRQRLQPVSHLKLAIDAGNGLAGREVRSVLSHYHGIQHWPIGFEPDPQLPLRGADPFSDQARELLGKQVRQYGCQLGAALSPDAAIIAVVDERGQPLSSDELGVILALWSAPTAGGRVLHDTAVNPRFDTVLKHAGIHPLVMKEKRRIDSGMLLEQDAFLYFDTKGRYVFPDIPGTSNALCALIKIINLIGEKNVPLSALAASLDENGKPAKPE
ncbi:MAG: hypothetical protein P8Y64_08875 [Gammaproteobacteria bacterium]